MIDERCWIRIVEPWVFVCEFSDNEMMCCVWGRKEKERERKREKKREKVMKCVHTYTTGTKRNMLNTCKKQKKSFLIESNEDLNKELYFLGSCVDFHIFGCM